MVILVVVVCKCVWMLQYIYRQDMDTSLLIFNLQNLEKTVENQSLGSIRREKVKAWHMVPRSSSRLYCKNCSMEFHNPLTLGGYLAIVARPRYYELPCALSVLENNSFRPSTIVSSTYFPFAVPRTALCDSKPLSLFIDSSKSNKGIPVH